MATNFNFDLLPATAAIVADGAGTAVPNMGYYDSLYLMLNCSAVPVGGAPTLDVYVQHSPDGGTTWQDIVHTQFTTSALKRFASICGQAAGSTSIIAASDGALAGETVVQGPWADRLRVRYKFSAGGGAGGYTLAVSAVPKGGVV